MLPIIPLPQVVNQLLKAIEWPGANPNVPRQVYVGSVVSFYYIGQRDRPIHDAYPFLMVSDIFSNAIRGVNLNYLDSPYVSKLLINFLDNPHFSYTSIKNDSYIQDSFRTYKNRGISQLRIYDSKFLRALAYVAPRLDPNEIAQIERQIEMLKEQAMRQPEAGEMV